LLVQVFIKILLNLDAVLVCPMITICYFCNMKSKFFGSFCSD
jgi:hypothetical protein